MKKLTSLSQEKRIFQPNPELASHAAIRSMDAYRALYQQAKDEPDRFWEEQAINLWAKSRRSLGPWPQIPMYLSCLLQAAIAIATKAFTAGSRSSKTCAGSSMPLSRSSPGVSCVKSFEPMLKPS